MADHSTRHDTANVRSGATPVPPSLDKAFWAIVDGSYGDADLAELIRRCKALEQSLQEDGA